MTQTEWLRKLTNLNPDKGNAPHKPLMLLVFLDLVETGALADGKLLLTPELSYRFDTYFEFVRHRRRAKPDVRLPFHHLSTQKFWSPRMSNGELSKHRSLTEHVVPDGSFIAACKDADFRRQAREILVETHFEPAERNALYHSLGLPIPAQDRATSAAFFATPDDAEIAGRNAKFRLDVVSAYKYTCALTGYRVTTIGAGAIVDAAHIHQFADSRNNDPRNGIALCKNAHWMFDIGLWSVDDDYRVIVAIGAFAEESPNQKPLGDMNGQRLALPTDEQTWPSKAHLAWHRERKFKGTT